MEDAGGFPIDLLMLVCAGLGVARAFERLTLPEDSAHDWVRLIMVAVIVANAAGGATHWRHLLYGTLMPLGAYYAGRTLTAPIARWHAERKRTA